ncbi:AAA family ATPase [Leclercia sp. Marseille-Q4284]|uniref:AAA family ATPase n=1 Tax=Leclercia sp. Marseille-Q4284 TaxID=2866582 RepID=UPI001CE45737|nr:AAA family ATPase [Leclercia sp. Marseille-Q4284]
MLTTLGVKNLRSFTNECHFKLAPITVFVGRNSSGKSSLLRTFPLMRQSFEANTTGPILWYGRLVDFGDFEEAISKNNQSNNIEFSFGLKPSEVSSDPFAWEINNILEGLDVVVKLIISSVDKKTITKEINITVDHTKLTITMEKDYSQALFSFQNKKYKYHKNVTLGGMNIKFLPTLVYVKNSDETGSHADDDIYWNGITRTTRRSIFSRRKFEREIVNLASEALKPYFHRNTNLESLSKVLWQLSSISRSEIINFLQSSFSDKKFFINQISDSSVLEDVVSKMQVFMFLKSYNLIADAINENLRASFESIKYLAPIRASTERYYRFQDLQVNEMDHTGSNLAMILNSFSAKENDDFQSWIRSNFGFNVTIEQSVGHYAIMIQNENDSTKHNISDMGFGYSQVLPIILSIWLETQKDSHENNEAIFVIEQPELHLHPAYQTKLAILFAKIIELSKQTKSNIKIIFETHSQQMIDAFGDCIENAELNFNKNDVSILIFDKEDGTGTSVHKANFDDQGYFENWPVGFFSGK